MLSGDALDDPLEQHGVVGGLQSIGMQQVDLKLANAVFGDGGVGRNVLFFALQVDVAEEFAKILQLVEREDGVGIEALAGIGRNGRNGGVRLRVDKIELEFGSGDGLEPKFGIAPDDASQRLARIAEEGGAGILEEPERHHGARACRPVDGQRTAAGSGADAVGVTAGKDHRVAHDILAPDVDADNGERHADAIFGDPACLFYGDALAAHDAVEVAYGGMQHFDLWVIGQPGDDIGVIVFRRHA